MIWTNKEGTENVGVHFSENGIFLNYFGTASDEALYDLKLEEIKQYLTQKDYLDLQREIFSELV